MLSSALRMKRLAVYAQLFLLDFPPLGTWQTDRICLEDLTFASASTMTTPTILRVKTAPLCHEDPAQEVTWLARREGLTPSKLKFFSVTPEVSESSVANMLRTAMVRGHWLVLTNLELNPGVVRHCCKHVADATNLHK